MVYDIKGPYWSVDVDVDGVARLLELTSKKFGKPPVSVENFLDLVSGKKPYGIWRELYRQK